MYPLPAKDWSPEAHFALLVYLSFVNNPSCFLQGRSNCGRIKQFPELGKWKWRENAKDRLIRRNKTNDEIMLSVLNGTNLIFFHREALTKLNFIIRRTITKTGGLITVMLTSEICK